MKVADIRHRIGLRLQQAAREKDPDSLALALDYGRAVLLALASLDEEAEVDLSEATVNTATAARILSFHVEYVRDLIRREVLPASKRNNEYDIRLVDLMDFIASPRYQAVGAPGAVARAALRRFRDWGMTVWRRPWEEPGSAV
ncbi:MAG: helix-turn-helix domain-containing protein [Chloroflexota bacterium]|nr:helix-turn-helix domain-containing protein [Chloroflexota bacterium]